MQSGTHLHSHERIPDHLRHQIRVQSHLCPLSSDCILMLKWEQGLRDSWTQTSDYKIFGLTACVNILRKVWSTCWGDLCLLSLTWWWSIHLEPGLTPEPMSSLTIRSADMLLLWQHRRVYGLQQYPHTGANTVQEPGEPGGLSVTPRARRRLLPSWKLLCYSQDVLSER